MNVRPLSPQSPVPALGAALTWGTLMTAVLPTRVPFEIERFSSTHLMSVQLDRLTDLAVRLHDLTRETCGDDVGARSTLDGKIERLAIRFDRAHARLLSAGVPPKVVFETRDALGRCYFLSLHADGVEVRAS